MTIRKYISELDENAEIVLDIQNERENYVYNSVRNGIRTAGFALKKVPNEYLDIDFKDVLSKTYHVRWYDRFAEEYVDSLVISVLFKEENYEKMVN